MFPLALVYVTPAAAPPGRRQPQAMTDRAQRSLLGTSLIKGATWSWRENLGRMEKKQPALHSELLRETPSPLWLWLARGSWLIHPQPQFPHLQSGHTDAIDEAFTHQRA